MSQLKYKIGGMDICPDGLELGSNPRHRFLVREEGGVLSIYIANERSADVPKGLSGGPLQWTAYYYRDVLKKFGFDPLDKSIVGAGDIYLKKNGQLVFVSEESKIASDYSVIPNQVALEFGKLLLPELKKMGFEIKEISVGTNLDLVNEIFLSEYWEKLGFERKITQAPLVLKV